MPRREEAGGAAEGRDQLDVGILHGSDGIVLPVDVVGSAGERVTARIDAGVRDARRRDDALEQIAVVRQEVAELHQQAHRTRAPGDPGVGLTSLPQAARIGLGAVEATLQHHAADCRDHRRIAAADRCVDAIGALTWEAVDATVVAAEAVSRGIVLVRDQTELHARGACQATDRGHHRADLGLQRGELATHAGCQVHHEQHVDDGRSGRQVDAQLHLLGTERGTAIDHVGELVGVDVLCRQGRCGCRGQQERSCQKCDSHRKIPPCLPGSPKHGAFICWADRPEKVCPPGSWPWTRKWA